MDRDEIRRVVKGLIAKVTDLAPEDIADNASFRDDLELDSLAMIARPQNSRKARRSDSAGIGLNS